MALNFTKRPTIQLLVILSLATAILTLKPSKKRVTHEHDKIENTVFNFKGIDRNLLGSFSGSKMVGQVNQKISMKAVRSRDAGFHLKRGRKLQAIVNVATPAERQLRVKGKRL